MGGPPRSSGVYRTAGKWRTLKQAHQIGPSGERQGEIKLIFSVVGHSVKLREKRLFHLSEGERESGRWRASSQFALTFRGIYFWMFLGFILFNEVALQNLKL